MRVKLKSVIAFISLSFLLTACDVVDNFESKARSINEYERVSLALAKENRELKAEISRLNYETQKLRSKQNYLQSKLVDETKRDRSIASVRSGVPGLPVNNVVQFDVYQWSPEQLLSAAKKSFDDQEFSKAAEFYHAMAIHYPDHSLVNDQFHYQAGIAAFESGEHPEWTLYHMKKLTDHYPTSKFYRGAKLWSALTNLQLGHGEEFFETVEEFRMKYRNTQEWRILSVHYEDIMHEFKAN